MDSHGKLSIDDIITRLKVKKNEIMKDEEILKDKMGKFYSTLREAIDGSEKEVISKANQEVLDFQEKIGGFIKEISRNSKTFDYSKEEERVNELLDTKIVIAPKVDLDKFESLIRNLYEVKTTSEAIKGEYSEYFNQIPEIYSENSSRIKQTPSEQLVEKMQEERDYYMLREQQLNSKIKELQNALARKGLNIKEMSKSYLEQKCSKWSLDRLKEEKKILVEKIGEASQEIIRLNSQASEYQLEIRKLNNFLNEINGRSVIGSSIIKNNSLLMDTEIGRRDKGSYIEEANRDKEIELEFKNEQLIVEITKLMKRTQEDSQQIHALEAKIQSNQQTINQLHDEVNSLKQMNEVVNHDYQISLRRKAAFQQECGELKNQLKKLNQMAAQQKDTYKNIISDFEQKQKEIINQVKSLEQSKQQEINRLEVKLKGFQIERERLVMKIEELSNKKGEQVNVKQLLNDQINRLLKENAILSTQLQLKEENAFMLKEQSSKLTLQNRQLASKIQNIKKQASKFKKQNKQFEKQFSDLQKRLNDQENVEFKVAQLDQNYHTLHHEYVKYKESCERRATVNERIISLMKERFSNQISTLLAQENKAKGKKLQGRQEVIEKYIEEMVSLSTKTAQIKQLKQQIRELKQAKQAKNAGKKIKSLATQQSVTNLQNGLWMLGTKIMQERLKAEKSLFEEQIKESKQIIAKEECLRISLQQQLEKQRIMIVEMRSKQKQEQSQQDSSKFTKQYEQKIDKMEAELKGCRAMIRKLQAEGSENQAEVKSKRELAVGLKKECKEKQDIIKELKIQINFNQEELEKLKRASKEIVKKEAMFKEIKDKQTQLEEQNGALKRNVETLEDRLKLLNKQIGKKDEVLKELRSLEQRQIKTKEQGRIKEANETINDHKETIRKLKAEVDRKDQIIKSLRGKTQSKSKQLEEIQSSKERQLQRLRKELEISDRKLETTKNSCKKQQTKNFLLGVTLKKLYQYCCSINLKEEKTIIKHNRHESTHYFSGSSASSHILKSSTPINNFKATPLYEGLAILNLSTQDLFDIKADTLGMSKIQPHCESYEVGSPIISKKRQQQREDLTHQGIQQLQKLLSQKQLDSQTITNLFKRALQR